MKNQRKIDLIVVHCSATRINQDFPVEALEACHKTRGLHSIGYHSYHNILISLAEGNRLPSLESPNSSQKFVLFEIFVFKIIPACKS